MAFVGCAAAQLAALNACSKALRTFEHVTLTKGTEVQRNLTVPAGVTLVGVPDNDNALVDVNNGSLNRLVQKS